MQTCEAKVIVFEFVGVMVFQEFDVLRTEAVSDRSRVGDG